MAKDGFVQVAPDSTGKKIDNTQLDVTPDADPQNPVEVFRQRVNIADPLDPRALLRLHREQPGPLDYALPVRLIDGSEPLTQDGALRAMVALLERAVSELEARSKYSKLDTILALDESEYVVANGRLLQVKRTFANVAASQTDSALVAAVAGRKVRVLSYRVLAGATATNVTFNTKPDGAGTAVSELIACGANGGLVGPYSKVGHFETKVSEGLAVTTGSGSTVGIGVVYVEVPIAALPPLV
jgi:hypothetical protein